MNINWKLANKKVYSILLCGRAHFGFRSFPSRRHNMLRLTVKCRFQATLCSKARPAISGRKLSSLGNPMFPHRPLPELETFEQSIENSKKAKKENDGKGSDKKEFIDILADHGGKIALAVFGGIIGLFYTYYASGKDRNKLEDSIADAALIEPYEIQELRFTNKLSKDDFISIVDQCKAHFTSGQATYVEFVHFLRDSVVLPALNDVIQEPAYSTSAAYGAYGANNANAKTASPAPRKVQLKSTHLLDRLMMGLVQNKLIPTGPSAASSGSSSTSDRDNVFTNPSGLPSPASKVSWTSSPLDVDLLLVVLNLVMEPDAEARIQALYALATQYPAAGQSASGVVNGNTNSGDGEQTQGQTQTQSQDTVSRGNSTER